MCYLWDDKWTQHLPTPWNRQGPPVFGEGSSQPQARRGMLCSLTVLSSSLGGQGSAAGDGIYMPHSWAGSSCFALLQASQDSSLTCCCLLRKTVLVILVCPLNTPSPVCCGPH